VAHLYRGAVNELARRFDQAPLGDQVAAQLSQQPAQSTCPPVELALVQKARKERQVVVPDKAQKLPLLRDAEPVLGNGESEDFAVAEERLFPAFPASSLGAYC